MRKAERSQKIKEEYRTSITNYLTRINFKTEWIDDFIQLRFYMPERYLVKLARDSFIFQQSEQLHIQSKSFPSRTWQCR